MQQNTPNIDRRTMYLLSNGDITAWSSQILYEYAWDNGIRRLKEGDLKPDFLTRRSVRRSLTRMDRTGMNMDRWP